MRHLPQVLCRRRQVFGRVEVVMGIDAAAHGSP
jgi:hypothetical protein